MKCPDCNESESHAPNCIRLRERDYKAPQKVKHYNKTAPVDFEYGGGRRRENKGDLR